MDLAPATCLVSTGGGATSSTLHTRCASDAIASMNLFDLGGQFLRVGRGEEGGSEGVKEVKRERGGVGRE